MPKQHRKIKPGRKPNPTGRKVHKTLFVVMSEEQRLEVIRRATASGRRTSEYVRCLLFGDPRTPLPRVMLPENADMPTNPAA